MNTCYNLSGLRVLNTRAPHQAKKLNAQIAAAQGISVPLPVFHIKSLEPEQWVHTLPALESISIAIFTSVNAVTSFFQGLDKYQYKWPGSIQVFAIGSATAEALKTHQISAAFPEQSDSEHLLALPLLTNLKRASVLIIKGHEGRPLIRDTLEQKKIILHEVSVYERQPNSAGKDQFTGIWQNDAVDIILGTSQFAIETLFSFANNKGKEWLRSKPWLVLSQRLKEITAQSGVKNVWVSEPRNLLKTLYQFRQGLMHEKE